MMKNSLTYILFAGLTTLMLSCNEYNRRPGRVYAPDMFYSRAVDYYNGTQKIEKEKGFYNKMPVPGTVAQNQFLPDNMTEEDTTYAKAYKNPFVFTEADVDNGKRLYNIQCGICHGTNLDGNGPLYASGKFAAMPANLKGEKYLAMTEGTIYHAIKFGKNAMGSYASQLDTKERWQVIAYIKQIQSENGGSPFTMISKPETTETAAIQVANDSTKSEPK
ncbi:MAG: cytochrome c [Chitinophagaceae bacterium]|nr:MAG: cytochrome C class I [Bacteroidetes bacterium OLB11]MCC6448165.1 cytochrome c [Chitinophagaceae bacterium]HMN33749.1 cytochrome c [Chitinophagaceae bacterium]